MKFTILIGWVVGSSLLWGTAGSGDFLSVSSGEAGEVREIGEPRRVKSVAATSDSEGARPVYKGTRKGSKAFNDRQFVQKAEGKQGISVSPEGKLSFKPTEAPISENRLRRFDGRDSRVGSGLAPGVYRTFPYSGIVVVPELTESDKRSIVPPPPGSRSRMPIFPPDLSFVPVGKGEEDR